MNIETDDIDKVFSTVGSWGKQKTIVVTNGANPIAIWTTQGLKYCDVKQMEESQIRDTDGAGDAFVGGFLAKYIQGCAIEECLNCGVLAAQETMKNVGCSFNSDRMYKICNQ